MSLKPAYVGDAIGLLIAALYTASGQAHFTFRYTPGLAGEIEHMTRSCYEGGFNVGLEFATVSLPNVGEWW